MSQNKLLRRLGTTALILATALLAAPVAAMGIGLPSVPKLPSAPRVNTPSLPSPPRVTAPQAPSVPLPNLNSGGGGLGGGGGSGGTAGGGGGGGSGASGGAGSGAPASSFAGAGSSPDGSGARSSAGGNADASAGAGAEGGASGQAASSGGSSEDANFELARRGDGAARKRDTFVRRLGGDLSHLQGCLGGLDALELRLVTMRAGIGARSMPARKVAKRLRLSAQGYGSVERRAVRKIKLAARAGGCSGARGSGGVVNEIIAQRLGAAPLGGLAAALAAPDEEEPVTPTELAAANAQRTALAASGEDDAEGSVAKGQDEKGVARASAGGEAAGAPAASGGPASVVSYIKEGARWDNPVVWLLALLVLGCLGALGREFRKAVR